MHDPGLEQSVSRRPGSVLLSTLLEREGFVLAAASAGGTLSAFFFQFGYLNYFGVPMQFIELDLIGIITAVIPTILVFFTLFVAFSLLFRLLRSIHDHSRSFFEALLGLTIISIPLFAMSGASLSLWVALAVIVSAALLWDICRPLLGKRHGESYRERRIALEKAKRDKKASPPESETSTLGQTVMPAFTAILWLIMLIVSAGRLYARMERSHLVPADAPNLVLVTTRSDTMIFKSWDPLTNKLQDTLVFRKIGESGETNLVLRHTGPLKQAPYPPAPVASGPARP